MHKTWWGEEFVTSLEGFIDSGRLQRGKAYRTDSRILKFDIKGSTITATVRGNKNPYFGVTTEPKYKIKLAFKTISDQDWQVIISKLSQNASWLSKLMLNEIPRDIEEAFGGQHFLPKSYNDIDATCSCPDWENPCKHIAGIYYRIAGLLDVNPMMLFPLRGIQADQLHQQLKQSELGAAFVEHLTVPDEVEVSYVNQLYALVETSTLNYTHPQQFWSMAHFPEPEIEEEQPAQQIQAALIKKQGDYPAFWDRSNSFIQAMEHIYATVKQKNKKGLL
ncbi:SWIM zinc finger family protein [Francisellaceae bacterium]|nr:SWIM zinc finger family protein [Francisellaceae bacterium]